MKENKILTILIPTYNRENELKKTLNMIYSYLIKLNLLNKVEILVGNNNSNNNNTLKLLNNFVEKYDNFKFYSNKKNLGITKNYLTGIKKIKTDFLWIFSDDDIFDIKIFLFFFDNYKKYDGFILNFETLNNKNKFSKNEKRKLIFKLIDFQKDKKNKKEFENFIYNLGLISIYIFKTKKLITIINFLIKKNKKINNNNYFNILMSYFYLKNFKSIYLKTPLVYQNNKSINHFNYNFKIVIKTFFEDSLEILKILKKEISEEIYKLYKKRIIISNRIWIVKIKIENQDLFKKLYISEYKIYDKYFIFFIKIFPVFFFIFFIKIYFIFK